MGACRPAIAGGWRSPIATRTSPAEAAQLAARLLPHYGRPGPGHLRADRTLDRSQGGLGIGLTLVERLVVLHGGPSRRPQPGLRQGGRVHRAPAGPGGNARRPDDGRRRARRPGTGRASRSVSSSWTTTRTTLRAWRCSCGPWGTTCGSPGTDSPARRGRAPSPPVGAAGHRAAGHGRLRGRPATAPGRRRWPSAVVVAMTGYGQPEDRRRSELAGFDGHLVKPVDPAAIEELLSSLASRA